MKSNVCRLGEGKTGVLQEKALEQGREPTKSAHIWHRERPTLSRE